MNALLAARRGDTERALAELAIIDALPIDGWHVTIRDATTADVHLALGNWAEAAQAAEQRLGRNGSHIGVVGGQVRDVRNGCRSGADARPAGAP